MKSMRFWESCVERVDDWDWESPQYPHPRELRLERIAEEVTEFEAVGVFRVAGEEEDARLLCREILVVVVDGDFAPKRRTAVGYVEAFVTTDGEVVETLEHVMAYWSIDNLRAQLEKAGIS